MKNIPETISIQDIKIDIERNDFALNQQELESNPQKLNLPLEVFPQHIKTIIQKAYDTLRYPQDYLASSILYTVSVAVGNTHWVEMKKGWVQNAILFLTLVGRPGVNKSSPLDFAVEPIRKKDAKIFKNYMEELNEYNLMTPKERKEQGLKMVEKPALSKYLVSDFTPEALINLHYNNLRGMGLCMDELIGLFKNFNRYNGGGEQEFWLSLWSGKSITYDRKNQNCFIEKPFISIIGTTQTDLLQEITKDNRSKNGFMDRILFVIIENLQKEAWSEEEMPQDWIEAYSVIIQKFLDFSFEIDEKGNYSTKILKFTDSAKKRLFAWQKLNTELANNQDNDALAGMYSKLETYIGRFALILQMLHWACGEEHNCEEISLKIVEKAIVLTEYFRATATRIHHILFNQTHLDKLDRLKRKVYEALPERFKSCQGVIIAQKLGMGERTFRGFIQDKKLFEKLKQGDYDKLL
jgi:hypothetical protein